MAGAAIVALLAGLLLANSVSRSIGELTEACSRLARGELLSLSPSESEDEIGQLRNALSGVAVVQRDSALAIDDEREKLRSEIVEHVASSARAAEETAASMRRLSENASISASVAEQSRVNAEQGARAVQNCIDGMVRIRAQVQETSRRVKRLGERSQETGEIVQLLEDIADRTRMLSLNASIQAGMSGEGGRGFAVVAEEVQRLADRSATAIRKITGLIKSIQGETVDAAAAMEETTKEVVSGTHLANQAGAALLEIEAGTNRLADLVQSLAQAAERQAQNSEPSGGISQAVAASE
jgi:twitching motility protein PilJ